MASLAVQPAESGPERAEPTLSRPARGGLVRAAATLWWREMVRFFRQRNRVIGALATPIIFWLLLGSGLDRALVLNQAGTGATSAAGYLAYLFPGALGMILLFTAIFSTITVIEDRREGFLQAVLVAPIPRLAIVLGKVLGGASIATVQGLVFLALWPLAGGGIPNGAGFEAVVPWLIGVTAVMFLVAAGLTALSLCIAWPMDSTAGFHAVMNLLLMPMWFLSGALFPVSTAADWLRPVMYLNPLTYGQTLLTAALRGPEAVATSGVSVTLAATVTVIFTLAALAAAARVARKT